jgi:hypothetical protein
MTTPLAGRSWWIATGLVLALALVVLVPTTGDFGLTYDEPAYRYSQQLSVQWWERLASARSGSDLAALVEPDALLYYWPYARHGINFHPPLAGQLNLLTYGIFGGFMKDIPARRMASVIEFASTVTILFGFLARRYGAFAGIVAAGSLLLMPRLYGQAHLIDTDTPGLLLWAATAVCAWKGWHEPGARRWRVAVGVLLGLAFVEKMGAVLVLLPVLAWPAATRLRGAFRRGAWPAWVDGAATLGAMAAPLAIAYAEIRRLAGLLPPPQVTNLFVNRPASGLPGAILLAPLGVWVLRRLLARAFPRHPVWGPERPALETFAALLAFPPAVAWLGNPAWWAETLPRLAHYYAISAARKGSLPNIQILYFGQAYEYSLPWENAWVLAAITVPAGILAAGVLGLVLGVARARTDRLPLYFLAHLATLPILRMAETPGHDGVRLFLPTFFFLAAFAGWGAAWLADGLARRSRIGARWPRVALGVLVLGPAGWSLARIHPYELSYYNELIGGPRGAWDAGFELSYWYDAFTPGVIDELNRGLPEGAHVTFPNLLSAPMTFGELQSLGELRPDLRLGAGGDAFPYYWLLTHDSKAMAYTRLLFAMRPWYASRPGQLGGLRVATVADPVAASRAWALQLLTDAPYRGEEPPAPVPPLVRRFAPWLGRLWGEGLVRAKPLTLNEPVFAWARDDPEGLRRAARRIVERARAGPGRVGDLAARLGDPDAERLYEALTRYDRGGGTFAADLLRRRPEALAEAVEILARRPEAVRAVLGRYGFTDPDRVGGYLDRDLDRGR